MGNSWSDRLLHFVIHWVKHVMMMTGTKEANAEGNAGAMIKSMVT